MGTEMIHIVAVFLVPACLLVTCCDGSQSRIVKFTSKTLSDHNDVTFVGNDVLLLCEINDPLPIVIRKFQEKTSLNTSHGREKSLTYLLPSVQCKDMGIYECVLNSTETQKTEVSVTHCGPQHCQGDVPNRTIFVKAGERAKISLCVLSYPGLLQNIYINNTSVNKGAESNWTWDYQKTKVTEDSMGQFNINVSLDQIIEGEYGLLSIRIFSVVGIQYLLEYNIRILAPGPPECPAGVNVTGQGASYVTLSWVPGLDGGSDQSFHVYYSTDNVTWPRHKDTARLPSVNMTGLDANTTYYFRVVSYNQYTNNINKETLCEHTVFTKTSKDGVAQQRTLPASESAASFSDLPMIMGASSILVVLFLAVTLVMLIRNVKKRRQASHTKTGNSKGVASSQRKEFQGHQEERGEYISPEGLKYITLAHARDKTQKKKTRSKKQKKKEQITYTALDFIKTV